MRTLRTLDPKPGEGNWFKWAETASEASLAWQKEMAKLVVETEAQMEKKHLIAQNYSNFKHSLDKVDSNISILNFHLLHLLRLSHPEKFFFHQLLPLLFHFYNV